jgi:glutamate/tyrosine decarboxylase-like PLP-dependent enzyme
MTRKSEIPNSNKLQLSSDQMRELGYRVIDQLVEHFAQLPHKRVTQIGARAELEARLREPLPEAGSDPQEVLARLQRDVWKHISHTNHPRFFAFIPAPSNFVSAMAETLTAGYDPFAGTWIGASAAAQVELVTIDWLRQLCGYGETAGGHFVSGGSLANLTALAVARHVKLDDRIENAVIYFSDQTHACVDRALWLLGFANEQARKLPTGADYQLNPAQLREAVAQDRAAGRRPFCVIANAGTTNTGAIDPLDELADFCAAENLWLHVDGAYGAAAMLCERGRRLLAGLERADSLALDPHKWMFQPYETGVVLLRDGSLLRKSFHVLPEYMHDTQREPDEVNFCEQGVQLTRSFRALKLWLSFRVFGVAAFRAAIERGFELAELAEGRLRETECWQITSPATLGIVSFRYVWPEATEDELNDFNQRLAAAGIADGFAFASSTWLHSRFALRMCTINPRTTDEDIRATIERLEQLANELQ